MTRLEARLFCRIQWRYYNINVVAIDIETALHKIDEVYPLRYRIEPYSEDVDSLKIIYTEESDCFIDIEGDI